MSDPRQPHEHTNASARNNALHSVSRELVSLLYTEASCLGG